MLVVPPPLIEMFSFDLMRKIVLNDTTHHTKEIVNPSMNLSMLLPKTQGIPSDFW
jgi:hypothetical protein